MSDKTYKDGEGYKVDGCEITIRTEAMRLREQQAADYDVYIVFFDQDKKQIIRISQFLWKAFKPELRANILSTIMQNYG